MLEIDLDERFTIREDYRSWNVYRKTTYYSEKYKQEKTSEDITYHGDLKQALKYCVRFSVKEANSLQEVIDRIDDIEKKIDNMKFKEIDNA